MASKRWIFFIVAFVLLSFAKAENKKADSLKIVKTLKAILTTFKADNTNDLKIKTEGHYYKAAAYIVYRGSDKKRAWKDFVNYADKDERDETDNICKRISRTINKDANYKIIKYFTEKEAEGVWNVLIISCKIDGFEKK